jgi:hypothetical protein
MRTGKQRSRLRLDEQFAWREPPCLPPRQGGLEIWALETPFDRATIIVFCSLEDRLIPLWWNGYGMRQQLRQEHANLLSVLACWQMEDAPRIGGDNHATGSA